MFATARALLAAAYLAMAIPVALELSQVSRPVFTAGHLGALALLLAWAARVDPGDIPAFTRFYLRVWQLFSSTSSSRSASSWDRPHSGERHLLDG